MITVIATFVMTATLLTWGFYKSSSDPEFKNKTLKTLNLSQPDIKLYRDNWCTVCKKRWSRPRNVRVCLEEPTLLPEATCSDCNCEVFIFNTK